MKKQNPAKELYQRLRLLPCGQLWTEEVPAFDRATGRERLDRAAVVRAVGVVFSETGTPAEKEQARQWLRSLLQDPEEKIRRYAMTALPKIGVAGYEEGELLSLLEKTSSDREKKFLGRTLEKIGGAVTLEVAAAGRLGSQTLRKVEANVARLENPGRVRLDRPLTDYQGLRIHLHCRAGLEEILEDEVREHGQFRLIHRKKGLVAIAPDGSFTLADIYALRCFSWAGLVPGDLPGHEVEHLAAAITSPLARHILDTFTEGPVRYRLDFVSLGHQRNAVRRVGDRVYALCPELLNDSRNALWQINIQQDSRGGTVELTPRLRPDPRFAYRQGDVPAASHPPLAACMARLAGVEKNELVWDPFCGSGLELIECMRRSEVRGIFGTDRSAEALATTKENLAAAGGASIPTTLVCGDFRDYAAEAPAMSLIITNPPMGRRVPIPNLEELIEELFVVAEKTLRPGGRLVFANPLPVEPRGKALQREFRRKIDLGGFHCHLEKYIRR